MDLKYIQELLGHKSSKTTEIYTHVRAKNLSTIEKLLNSLLVRRKGNMIKEQKNNSHPEGCIFEQFGNERVIGNG
ncbi:MAG: tyrosine-type recombinase/integrase [Thermotogae bacterium]|nr:tyrosine-type recombinase/integrase [Thermotogota bacterium]